jgi:hypothetical protein
MFDMACYHFSIKTDKKPDGTQIAATDHIDYVNREGKFKNIDLEREAATQQFQGNFLCKPGEMQTTKNEDDLLYRSIYGSIMENSKGIETSIRSSVETMYIALSLAVKKYGNELQVEGSTDFKAKMIIAANEMNLPIKFSDPLMEKQRLHLKELDENGRKESREYRERNTEFEKLSKPNLKRVGTEPPPERRNSLHELSECGMVQYSDGTELLLPRDVSSIMEKQETNKNSIMRRDLCRARRIKADKTADKILNQKRISQVEGASHANYINRDEVFEAKGGCMYKNHHLPNWANNSPKEFFKAADRYEGVGYCRYKEIEFSLPNELTLEQQKEIINAFIKNHLNDFYYAYAVHDKIGSMSNGERHPHVHIMFSERKMDDREKAHERSDKEFFSRPSMSKEKEVGGCKKDEKWNSKNRAQYLCDMRKDFALIQNTALEKHGFSIRVDHRSLNVQRDEALANGDLKLAKLLDRLPEESLGPDVAAQPDSQKVIDLQKYRAYKTEHRQLLYAADLIENSIKEEESTIAIEENIEKTSTVANTDAFKNAVLEPVDAPLRVLKTSVLKTLKEINSLKSMVIWNDQAFQLARKKYMTPAELELFEKLTHLQNEKMHWQTFNKSLAKPADYNSDGLIAYKNVQDELDVKLQRLDAEIQNLSTEIQPVFKQLASPVMQKKIQDETMKILRDDKPTKEMLQKANEMLDDLIQKLQQEIISHTEKDVATIMTSPKNAIFTAKDIANILTASYKNLKAEFAAGQKTLEKLSPKIISIERAEAMAKDLYVNGAFKVLREKQRLLKKEAARIDIAKGEYLTARDAFSKISKPSWYQNKDMYIAEQTRVHTLKTTLEERETAFHLKDTELSNELNLLNTRCSSPEATSKIADITMGIKRKNLPITNKYDMLVQKQTDISAKIKNIQQLQKGVNRQVRIDQGKDIGYKLVGNISSNNTSPSTHSMNNAPSIIAAAICGDKNVTPLVAKTHKEHEELDYDTMDKVDREAEAERIENLERD